MRDIRTESYIMINTKIIDTPRLKQHIRTAGTATSVPVLLIHGNASSSVFWNGILNSLADQFYVVAPDLRGYGDTEDLTIDATRGMGDFVDDLLALLLALDISRYHVIGHSMGGSVLYALVAADGQRMLSATLVNPGSPFGFGGTKDLVSTGLKHWISFI